MPQWPVLFQGATGVWRSLITGGQGVLGGLPRQQPQCSGPDGDVAPEMAKRKGKEWAGSASATAACLSLTSSPAFIEPILKDSAKGQATTEPASTDI